jgi:hypothetical protein
MDEKAKEAKKRKAEDLLLSLEGLVETWKKALKEGEITSTCAINREIERLVVPYSYHNEFQELKGNWSPLVGVKWMECHGITGTNFVNERFALAFDTIEPNHNSPWRDFQIEVCHASDVNGTTISFPDSPSGFSPWSQSFDGPPGGVYWYKKLQAAIFCLITKHGRATELDQNRLKEAIHVAVEKARSN